MANFVYSSEDSKQLVKQEIHNIKKPVNPIKVTMYIIIPLSIAASIINGIIIGEWLLPTMFVFILTSIITSIITRFIMQKTQAN